MNSAWKDVVKRGPVVNLMTGIVLAGLFVSFIYFLKQTSPNKGDAKLKELRRLADELPTFPDFVEEARDETSRATDAGVYLNYCSTASYNEVKSFYARVLTSRGWHLLSEEELQHWFRNVGWEHLVFKDGELTVEIDYSGSLSRKCKYSISFVWRNKSFWNQ